MSSPHRKETKADTQASSIDKEKYVNNGVATLDSVDNTDNSNSLPATTSMPIPPTSAKRNIFSGMAPLHRPEFDSLVNIVKVLREDFRREREMVKPDIAILKEKVRESVLQYDSTKKELQKYMEKEKDNVENTHSRLNNSVGFILEEIENIKEDIDTQDNNSQDLLEWRSAANTELVNIASKVDRIELHVGMHKKMLTNLRNDYGEDHGRLLRMERTLKSIELNSDKMSDMIKQCVLKMNEIDKKVNTSMVEIKAYTDTQMNVINTHLRKAIDRKLESNFKLNQKSIRLLVNKINTLEGYKNENQEAIKNIVEVTTIFQENLANFISEYTISKRRQSEAMGKLDETISDVSTIKRTLNAHDGKILAMRESVIRALHASNSTLKQ
jgi:chromosome segregation ATPase